MKNDSFVMALALVCTNVPANLHVQTGTETVYAAQETAINSEQDLIAMQNNPKGKVWKKITGCSNTGNISVTNKGGKNQRQGQR